MGRYTNRGKYKMISCRECLGKCVLFFMGMKCTDKTSYCNEVIVRRYREGLALNDTCHLCNRKNRRSNLFIVFDKQ